MKTIAALFFSFMFLSNPVVLWAKTYDLVINNGFVIDGSGVPGRLANLAIKSGRIAYIGPRDNLKAKQVVDAKGLVVAPGFIDVHNHSEMHVGVGADLLNESFVRQGVTLVVIGPDGRLAPSDIARVKEYIKTEGSAIHMATYVGHNGVRKAVMGHSPMFATAEQLAQMKALVKEGMELGAVGLSTGLMYDPGMHSDTQEVIELAKVVAPYGGTYDSHVRDPVNNLVTSYREAIEIGEKAGIPAKIAHAKVVGLHNAGLFDQLRALINSARSKGLKVVTDQYPYDGAANTDLWELIALPEDLHPQDKSQYNREWVMSLLDDKNKREQLQRYNENPGTDFTWIKAVGYTSMRIVVCDQNPALVGKHLSELADERNRPAFDLIADLITATGLDINITLGSIAEADVQNFLMQPWNMISSDGAWSDTEASQYRHPRSTGTYPRVLGKYVREMGLLDLPTAIYKASGFPAEFMGFKDRGKIKEGYIADIVVFDPAKIIDRSDWLNPQHYSEGVEHLLVEGEFALKKGEMTGVKKGQFVRLKNEN